MESISGLFENSGKKLLAVFPHADDPSFVAGGLFQYLQVKGVITKLICLTETNDSEAFSFSSQLLGIDDYLNLGYSAKDLIKNKKSWISQIRKEIINYKPDYILTFDPHGITGHPDHAVTSVEILNLVQGLQLKSTVLWRIADEDERKNFDKGHNFHLAISPSHFYNLSFAQSIKKLRAIYAHKDKINTLVLKMRTAEWYLFDHKELYYKVNIKKDKFSLDFKNI